MISAEQSVPTPAEQAAAIVALPRDTSAARDARVTAAGELVRSLTAADALTVARVGRVLADARVLSRAEQSGILAEARTACAIPADPEGDPAGQLGRPPEREVPTDRGGVRASTGNELYARGVYRAAGDEWRWIAPLPYAHAVLVTRDGSGSRSGTKYLLSATGTEADARVIAADALNDGSWAVALGLPLSADNKVRQYAGSAITEVAHALAPERESVARIDRGRIARPPLACLPPGYLARSPLSPAEARANWRKIAEQATPVLADHLGAAAFGPFMGELHEQSHIVDDYGDPGQGKSTVLRVTAAMYGDANGEGGTFHLWDMTAVSLIRHLGQLGVLPAFIDESGAGDLAPADWAQLIYRVTGGAQRMVADRRDAESTLRSLPWHGVLFLTGNGEVTAGLGAGKTSGVTRRVIECEGPFTRGKAHAETIESLALDAYGHLGAALLGGFTAADAAAALALVRTPRPGGTTWAPVEQAEPAKTWAEEHSCHVAGAALLDELLGLGPAVADPDQWYPGTLAAEAIEHAWTWMEANTRPPEHDADRVLEAISDAIAAEPDRWPLLHNYRAAIAALGYTPGRGFAGVLDDNDPAHVAVFRPTFAAVIATLKADSKLALRELHKRGALDVPETRRRNGNWTKEARLLPRPAPQSVIYAITLPPEAPEPAASGAAELPAAAPEPEQAAPAPSPGVPLCPACGLPMPANPALTFAGMHIMCAPDDAEPDAPAEPAEVPAPRPSGHRDAASILMAHGRKVAEPQPPHEPFRYLLDGARVTAGQLTEAARQYEPPAEDDPAPDPLAAARTGLHLDRPCPRCGAEVSAPCRTASGRHIMPPEVHAEREAPAPGDAEHQGAEAPGWLAPLPPEPEPDDGPEPDRGEQVVTLGSVGREALGGPAPAHARPAGRNRPYLVLDGGARALGEHGEAVALDPPALGEVRHLGDLAALADLLGTDRLYVPRAARELLGLPAALPELGVGETWPHPFALDADPAEWDMHPAEGLAGWVTIRRQPAEGARGVQIAFPEWLTETPTLAVLDGEPVEPAELAEALALVHEATALPSGRGGVAFEHSAPATFKHLISQAAKWTRRGTPAAVRVAELPPYKRAKGRPRGTAALHVPGPYSAAAEVPAGWVLARLDVNQCYASAATGTVFGLGEPEHAKAAPGESLPLPAKLPGVALVMVPAGHAGPVAPGLMSWLTPPTAEAPHAVGWLDLNAARWLAERHVPLTVLESYTWPDNARVFESATERLGAALTRLRAEGSRPSRAAAAIVKDMSNRYLGGWLGSDFNGQRSADDWQWRPDWRHALVAQAEVRKQRNLAPAIESGALLVLGGEQVDTVYVAAASREALDQAPGTRPGRPLIRDGRGGFKIISTAEVTPELSAVLADPKGRRVRVLREALGATEEGK